jgi:hypothetical protein
MDLFPLLVPEDNTFTVYSGYIGRKDHPEQFPFAIRLSRDSNGRVVMKDSVLWGSPELEELLQIVGGRKVLLSRLQTSRDLPSFFTELYDLLVSMNAIH